MELNVIDCGLMSYDEAHALQLDVLEKVQAGELPDTLILVEHPAVITMGRNAVENNVLFSESYLESQGVSLRAIERGGDATYHGPGQLVGYPIFDIKKRHGHSIKKFVHTLEEIFIDYLAETHNIIAARSDVNAGVWIGGESKIVAIGLAVKRGVTFHGFALNVNTNLAHYQYIVPCGLVGKTVTSLEQQLGHEVPLADVKDAITQKFKQHYGFQ